MNMIPEKYKQYLLLFLVIGIGLSLYFNRTSELEKKIADSQVNAKTNSQLAQYYLDQYNVEKEKDNPLQSKYDSIKLELSKSQKTISNLKIQYNEKIKLVNRYSVSDMQHYFDKRYGTEKSSNSGFDTIKQGN